MMFRKNAAIVVFNQDKKVLLCKRADWNDAFSWQFPQGGIDEGETPLEAAYRELREETGITSVEFVAQTKEPLRYLFTPEILERNQRLGRTHIGQEQIWTLFFFTGKDREIDFHTHPEEVEFDAYEWVDIKDAPKRVWAAKSEVYEKVVKEFEPYIKNWKDNGREFR